MLLEEAKNIKKRWQEYTEELYKKDLHDPDSQYQNQIDYILCNKDGEALYSQQKQDWDLTVVQIMNSLLPNSDLN